MFTNEEARRIAINVARLPELFGESAPRSWKPRSPSGSARPRPNWRRRRRPRPKPSSKRRPRRKSGGTPRGAGKADGTPPRPPPSPMPKKNFTDPESRIMKSKDGFVQAYNAQAAVDAGAQIIVAHELTQCGNDQGQLVPLI